MNSEGMVLDKSKSFAIRIVKLYKYLCNKNEFVLSKQLLKSGTSIGANLSEAKYAQSRNDFLNKVNIALKEASETEYWLELLYKTEFISEKQYSSINKDCSEIIRMLSSSVKTMKIENKNPSAEGGHLNC
ncbi:four helix bundle protein [Ruminococcus sp. NK3A76]|uniref:four helix bundle protein n=1 Tax=Ruminococcus sp. NK3A76 TaxID=877411 RepID=UPI000569889B|nr:four helix bundle protein [Ruminococcus sp. NK3A76]